MPGKQSQLHEGMRTEGELDSQTPVKAQRRQTDTRRVYDSSMQHATLNFCTAGARSVDTACRVS